MLFKHLVFQKELIEMIYPINSDEGNKIYPKVDLEAQTVLNLLVKELKKKNFLITNFEKTQGEALVLYTTQRLTFYLHWKSDKRVNLDDLHNICTKNQKTVLCLFVGDPRICFYNIFT